VCINIVENYIMYSKKRYPANDALKKGSPSTIESACRKPDICIDYVKLREKYRALKTEYQKSHVKLEQVEQLKKDNDTKLIQLTKKSDLINKLHTTITQLKNDIQVLKDTSVNRCDAQRLEGLIKKKDLEIEDLKSQVDDEKPNNCATIKNLQNMISNLKTENEKIKEEHIHFNTIWKTEGITEQYIIDMKRQISNQCDLIKESKEENTQLQDELTELRKTLHSEREKWFTLCNKDNEEIKILKEKITDLYDCL